MTDRRVSVIIPTYRPDDKFRKLIARLSCQSLAPCEIIVVNTEEKYFPEDATEGAENIRVIHIRREEFDHGGTRDMAARQAQGDLLCFMTMDAVPANEKLLEKLADAFDDEQVAAAYARQLPAEDCRLLERYTRAFNYPAKDKKKTAKDMDSMGIKTFFCSNVCAMYRRDIYLSEGGFEKRTIFNEDMIFAGKLIGKGYAVQYCAGAEVIHSHNYSGREQFHRNFDLGVSQAEHADLFGMVSSENEGIRMVKKEARWLLKKGRIDQIAVLVYQSGCKYLGYRLGKRYASLPRHLVLMCTMNKAYWNR